MRGRVPFCVPLGSERGWWWSCCVQTCSPNDCEHCAHSHSTIANNCVKCCQSYQYSAPHTQPDTPSCPTTGGCVIHGGHRGTHRSQCSPSYTIGSVGNVLLLGCLPPRLHDCCGSLGGSPLAPAYSQGPPLTLVSTPGPALSNSGARPQLACHAPWVAHSPV